MSKAFTVAAVILWILVLVVFFFVPSCFADNCMSCGTLSGSALVCVGESPLGVLSKCGWPDYRDISGVGMAEKVERWYYDCGRGQFGRVVTIKGGVVVSIERLNDRGTGEPRCW